MGSIKKRYTVGGLACAGCAAELENRIRRLENIKSAKLDMRSKVLTVRFKNGAESDNSDKIKQAVEAARASAFVAQVDTKTAFRLSACCCADCAERIQREVGGLCGVKRAQLDMASKTLEIEPAATAETEAVAAMAETVVRGINPDPVVTPAAEDDDEENNDEEEKPLRWYFIAAQGIAAGLTLFCVLFHPALLLRQILLGAACLLAGGEVFRRAAANIPKLRIFDENFLMSAASIGAFLTGEMVEASVVLLLYNLGEALEDMAVDHSRRSIRSLAGIRPDYANIKTPEGIRRVDPRSVEPGSEILVKPGEKVPLDGIVTEGTASVNTSAMTGEPVPLAAGPGTAMLAGFVNIDGLLTVKAQKRYEDSEASRIIKMMHSTGGKAKSEKFITKFARWYTPAVVFSAAALAIVPPLLGAGSYAVWIKRALTFLVVSCPCALVISIPLGFFAGVGGASRRGILVKGGNFLEALAQTGCAVFDKTGTLTRGVFRVSGLFPTEGFSQEELLEYIAYAEAFSGHPIAAAIRNKFGKKPDSSRISGYRELPGRGVRAEVDGREVLAGNLKLLADVKNRPEPAVQNGPAVYIAVDGRYAGRIEVADSIKADAAKAVRSLREAGVEHISMLTGDSGHAGQTVADELKLDSFYTGLLPEQKVEAVEKLRQKLPRGRKLIFTGDGINDAPVIARADVGIAMGGAGSDAAVEAADVVIMTDEPSKVAEAVRIGRRTHAIVVSNIVFALAVKGVILILAAFGLANMWEAVFGDVGVALLCIANSSRAAVGGKIA